MPTAAQERGRPAAIGEERVSRELHRIILILFVVASAGGCKHLHWPHSTVPPPVETAIVCPTAEVCVDPCAPYMVDPCDPCAPCMVDPCDPCGPGYDGGYVLMEPGAAYVMPGAAVPAFPQSAVPMTQPTQSPKEMPGWFGFEPLGSGAISPGFCLPRGPAVKDRLPNPMVLQITNSELAWDQMADVVSTYFPISREQPVQLADGILTEGFIHTAPQSSSTLLEPLRKDTVGRFNRWESTLQSIRRQSFIRVVPTTGGWSIETQVFKELEDLPYPEYATAGMSSLRNDNSLPKGRVRTVSLTRESNSWIRLGRDEPLEQAMLREIHKRLTTGY